MCTSGPHARECIYLVVQVNLFDVQPLQRALHCRPHVLPATLHIHALQRYGLTITDGRHCKSCVS